MFIFRTDGRSGKGKHVVLVVVEGGTDAIVDASTSLESNIPVVLCLGTGRAADILAFAHTYCVAAKYDQNNDLSQRIICPYLSNFFCFIQGRKGSNAVEPLHEEAGRHAGRGLRRHMEDAQRR